MAVCALSRSFQRLSIIRKEIVSVYFSTQQRKLPKNVILNKISLERPLSNIYDHVRFTPRSLNLNYDIPRTGLPLNKIIECPLISNFQIDEPLKFNYEKIDIETNKIIKTPNTNNIEKQARNVIKIRRLKIKKHKKRKFLKRMKFVIRKKEARKRLLKQRQFEAELDKMYEEAVKFDPKQYVAERISILTKERLPNKWRGEYVPEDMIRQFMKEKEEKKAHILRLKTYRLKLD